MPTPPAEDPHPGRAGVRRRPEQLLLAFLGELVVDRDVGPLPTAEVIAVLGELGVGEAATRATLSRMTARGLLTPLRTGRSVAYALTPLSERVLREARGRVFAEDPFAPHGTGWTLVTFTVPESRRDLRHRVRAQLAWAGFGLLRDGLWIAPGEVDVAQALGEVREDVPEHRDDGGDLELVAFRAHEVPGFSAARSVRTAWRLAEMRSRHEEFARRWSDGSDGAPHGSARQRGASPASAPDDGAPHASASDLDAAQEGAAALRDLTALVADWLDLLRAVPRLPPEHLAADWPGPRSVAAFRRRHAALEGPARTELGRRLGG